MMRHRRYEAQTAIAENEPGLDLSSLVDVSFLLLIYFLVTSTLRPQDADLGMNLAGEPIPGKTMVMIDKPVIEIDAAGRIFMTEELLEDATDSRTLPVLRDRLTSYVDIWKLAPAGSIPGVIVSADDAAKGQRFIDVLNCLTEVGISDVVLANFSVGD